MRTSAIRLGLMVTLGLAAVGCTRHRVTVDPIQVEPIYIKADVNIKVDRELDSFFDFEEELRPDIEDTPKGGN